MTTPPEEAQASAWVCSQCGEPLVPGKVTVAYLGSAYPVDLLRCPKCGLVLVPEVLALGFTSPLLSSIGETEIIDELRVIVRDGTVTAYFTFSTQFRPLLHQFSIFGPKNGLALNEKQQTIIKLKGKPYKSYLEQFLPPWEFAGQYVANSLGNVRKFLKADFQEGQGMKVLMQALYRSISDGAPLPIPYSEILRTSRIMQEIFFQLHSSPTVLTKERLVQR